MTPKYTPNNIVDANLFLLNLGQNCTYKTSNTLGQGQEPQVPTMDGGFSQRTSDVKVRILKEKYLRILAKELEVTLRRMIGFK